MTDRTRTIVLKKDEHRFVFRFAEGQEAVLLAAFVSLAEDPVSGFDWYDAAVLSLEMGRPIRNVADMAIRAL